MGSIAYGEGVAYMQISNPALRFQKLLTQYQNQQAD
jgi:hypothetical protein